MEVSETQGTLLIVDDEPYLLEMMAAALSELTPNILIAENGKKALEIIRSHHIHTVISDVNMPVMSGLELLKALRIESIPVPVILVTATKDQNVLENVKRLGVLDCIDKPFKLDLLLATVKRGLELGLKQSKLNSNFRKDERLEFFFKAA